MRSQPRPVELLNLDCRCTRRLMCQVYVSRSLRLRQVGGGFTGSRNRPAISDDTRKLALLRRSFLG
jgi:hypothetical protein